MLTSSAAFKCHDSLCHRRVSSGFLASYRLNSDTFDWRRVLEFNLSSLSSLSNMPRRKKKSRLSHKKVSKPKFTLGIPTEKEWNTMGRYLSFVGARSSLYFSTWYNDCCLNFSCWSRGEPTFIFGWSNVCVWLYSKTQQILTFNSAFILPEGVLPDKLHQPTAYWIGRIKQIRARNDQDVCLATNSGIIFTQSWRRYGLSYNGIGRLRKSTP